MTPGRAVSRSVLAAALILAAALVAYAFGQSNSTTGGQASAKRETAERVAFTSSRTRAFVRVRAAAYGRGIAVGRAAGKARGARDASRRAHVVMARRKRAAVALARRQQAVAAARATQGCPSGQYTTPTGSCAPNPPGYGTPPANSPQGLQMIQQDPTCQNPPPPPGYSGPVQCNNP